MLGNVDVIRKFWKNTMIVFSYCVVSLTSKGSTGGGFGDVFTAQNIQPRVQVSPSNIIVPVPPFQHSP